MNRRDRVVHKGSSSKIVYQAVHLKSTLGYFPVCHVRPVAPVLTEHTSEVDCRYCSVVIREQFE